MKYRVFIGLFVLLSVITLKVSSQKTSFDKTAFYAAAAADDMDVINSQLSIVKISAIAGKQAYEGFLLMKKAGMIKGAKEKLSLFKSGRIKLDASMKTENDNVEYNFLRLIIQEHAPKVVKYNENIMADVTAIQSGYKTLPQVVQHAISDYSKKSKFLKPL